MTERRTGSNPLDPMAQPGPTDPPPLTDPPPPDEHDPPPIQEQDATDRIDDPADPGAARRHAGTPPPENRPKGDVMFDENASGR